MGSKIKDGTQVIVKWVMVASSLFILYTAGFGLLSALTQRSIHWVFMSFPIFLLFPMLSKKKERVTFIDHALAVAAVISGLYLTLTWGDDPLRLNEPSAIDTAMGIVMILVVLEGSRRTIGMSLTVIALLFLAYAFLGPYVPGAFRHKGFDVVSLVSFLYSTTEGIFSLPMGTSATYIIIYVLFGAFLTQSGAGKLFVDLAHAATGRLRSGPAQTAILSNALMGIISGSPVANVVTTGAFAIPLMKETGYPMMTAAALLAVAATGSMFTPPVMGAGAFMIADYLSVPYGEVVKAAVIPAALFYLSLVIFADVTAVRSGLKGLRREELPDWKKALLQRGHLLIPIISLVVFIVIGWSALKTAFWCVILMLVLSWMKPETRMGFRKIVSALESGSRDTIIIASACAVSGIIVGTDAATGLGVKLSSYLNALSGNNPILALILTMAAALILGLSLPPTPVYIILAALTIPSLIAMGIAPMAAHFFVFYYASIGAITPPVALSAYAASGIAKTDPWMTGWVACRMGLVSYIVPFAFVLDSALILGGKGSLLEILYALISVAIGVVVLCFGVEGYFRRPLSLPTRICWGFGGLGFMLPGLTFKVIGCALAFMGLLTMNLFPIRQLTEKNKLESLEK
jgi:TRAP transporter 4TM/12TM fusion protein